jgi:hypothetical protein
VNRLRDSTPAARLRAARKAAGFKSAAAAAQSLGWEEPAYRHHENGTRSFAVGQAVAYAAAFKVTPGWLLNLGTTVSPTNYDPIAERASRHQARASTSAGETASAPFTPGPWLIEVTRDFRCEETVYKPRSHTRTGIAVDISFWSDLHQPPADEHGYYQPDAACHLAEHRISNARLIAAAPDLYEAALPLEQKLAQSLECFDRGDYALGGPISDEDGVIVSIGVLRKIIAALAKARGEA